MLMRVTAVDYRTKDGRPIIQVAGRGEDGKRKTFEVEHHDPYFYVFTGETEKFYGEDAVRGIEEGYRSYDGIPLAKIICRHPSNAGERGKEKNLTELVDETWEADIPFYRRISIDEGYSGYIEISENGTGTYHEGQIRTDIDITSIDPIDPRVFIADIETLNIDGVSFDRMRKDHSQPISHITVWDSYEEDYSCLYLDPEGEVEGSRVKELLQAESDGTSVFDETELPIRLRCFETEEALLRDFIGLVKERQPDIVSGWNFVDFDWDYILGRIDQFDRLSIHQLSDIGWASGYQTERRIDCLPAFDMLKGYKKMTIPVEGRKRSYSLDYISKDELGIGKLPNISVLHEFRNDRSRCTAYNIMDVMLCVALERVQGMHDFFLEVAELAQVQIFDTSSEMRVIDGYIMSRSDDDEVLPSIDEKEIPENAGGLVLDPSSGVHDWVSVIDLKSLYPSCMLTWNLSPETIHWYDEEKPSHENIINVPWLPDADHAEGGRFTADDIDFERMWVDLDEEGIVPKYLKQLFPEREKYKKLRNQCSPDTDEYGMWDRKQAAVKVVMNAFYGVCSMDYWRLATHGLGDAITSSARFALWSGKEIIEDQGYNALYGDTDSIFVEVGDESSTKEECLREGYVIQELVNDRIGMFVDWCGLEGEHPLLDSDLHGTEQHTLVYEFEKLYRRFFQPGRKKRYAGNIVWKEGKDVDGDVDITGLESQRSDSPEITSDVQPEVIRRILDGQGFDEVSGYIQEVITEIEDGTIDKYRIAFPKSLGQSLDEYGNTPAARACRYSNKHLGKEWDEGNDPWMYFISKTPPMEPGTDVISLGWDEDIPEGFELDMEKTIERAIENPLSGPIESMGWSFTEVKTGAQTQSASAVSGDWGSYEESTDEQDEAVDEVKETFDCTW